MNCALSQAADALSGANATCGMSSVVHSLSSRGRVGLSQTHLALARLSGIGPQSRRSLASMWGRGHACMHLARHASDFTSYSHAPSTSTLATPEIQNFILLKHHTGWIQHLARNIDKRSRRNS